MNSGYNAKGWAIGDVLGAACGACWAVKQSMFDIFYGVTIRAQRIVSVFVIRAPGAVKTLTARRTRSASA